MRMRPTMLLATLLAVGLMPITAQAQQQGNQRPTPRQTIQNTDPEDTYEGNPDSRRGTATQERRQGTTQGRTQGTIQGRTQGTTTERSTQFRGESATASSQNVDQQISLMAAAEMAIMNDCEIKTAQLAKEKIDNEQVKQFADTLIRDHQQLNQQLMQAMPELRGMVQLHSSDRTSQSTTESTESRTVQSGQSSTRGVDTGLQSSPDRQAGTQGQAQSSQQARAGDQSDNRTAQGTQSAQQGQQQAQSGTIRSQESELSSSATERATGYRGTTTQEGSGSMNPVMMKMLSICQEKAKNNLEMTRQEFSEKQGKELEMCYMGSQVVMHQAALAHLKALQDEGTPEFQQIVQQAEESVQQHLTQAKAIVEDLSKESDSHSSSRDNQNRTSPNASGSASPGGVPNGQNN